MDTLSHANAFAIGMITTSNTPNMCLHKHNYSEHPIPSS